MGLRVEDQKLKQQAYRDYVNSLYMQSIMGKLEEETRLLEPRMQLELYKTLVSARGALQKDVEYLRSLGKSESEIEDYISSKMGDIGEYEKYVRQKMLKNEKYMDFDAYLRSIGRSRATRISMGEKIATRVGTEEALDETKALGSAGWDKAQKRVDEWTDSDEFFALSQKYINDKDAPEKIEKLKIGRLNVEYELVLKSTFGDSNVVRGKQDGKYGWQVTKKDGTKIFVERRK